MKNKLKDYLEYLFVTGELDKMMIDDLVNKYNDIYGELPEGFFYLELEEQRNLLEKALKYKVKIIKK